MSTLQEAAHDFLAQRRIAVAGVSRAGGFANAICQKLRDTGHEVFPINPHAREIDGAPCYPDLAAIPGGVDALLIATPPEAAADLVRQCGRLHIGRVWMHRSVGPGSVSEEAVRLCRELGITVIPGACPMMFCEPVDVAHRCARWFMRVTGGLPQPAGAA